MTKKEIFKQILNFIPVVTLSINVGICYIWTSPVLYQLQKDGFELTVGEISLIGSIPYYGKMTGCPLTCILMDKIGRKKCIILCSIGVTIQWGILTCFKNVPAILISRFIYGISQSTFLIVCVIYVAENCYPSMRGVIMALKTCGCCFGHLLGYILLSYLKYYLAHSLMFITSLITTVLLLFIVESPEFLLSQDRFDQAKKNFFSIRSTEKETDLNYFQELKTRSKIADSFFIRLRNFFSSKTPMKGMKILIIVDFLASVGTAGGPLHSYSTLLYSQDADEYFVKGVSIANQVCSLLGAFFATTLVERFNRKSFYSAGFLVYLLNMMSLAILYRWHYFVMPIEYFDYYVFAVLSIIEFVYGAFLHPFMNCIQGELLPQEIKAIGSTMVIFSKSVINAFNMYIFWYVAKLAGIYLNFIIYSGVLVLTIVYGHFHLPETKNKSLIQIENELSGKRAEEGEILIAERRNQNLPIHENYNKDVYL